LNLPQKKKLKEESMEPGCILYLKW
jgi:hypothetical protein